MSKTCILKVEQVGMNEVYKAMVLDMTYDKAASRFKSDIVSEVSSDNIKCIENFLVANGVILAEFEIGLDTMEENGHNYAEFGVFGGFTYSMFDGKIQ